MCCYRVGETWDDAREESDSIMSIRQSEQWSIMNGKVKMNGEVRLAGLTLFRFHLLPVPFRHPLGAGVALHTNRYPPSVHGGEGGGKHRQKSTQT